LRKKGTFFTADKIYPLKSIKNIRKSIDQEQSSLVDKTTFRRSVNHKVFVRQVFGEILTEYQYDTIRVFNGLDKLEKEELITELLKWQEKFKTTH
jgi:hypothetical protein